jgi:N-acetylmuramoyl-L-alanine amidase
VSAFPSPNFGERRGGVRPDLVVLHYTVLPCAEARARLCDPAAEVSAHWLVAPDGTAEQLVDEGLRAWHAGAGAWGAVSDVNSRSIGIEMANSGDEPFPAPQMAALERLLAGVTGRWPIPPQRVIGHSDMAPARKRDPGARFDWRRLALGGLSVWPEGGAAVPDEGEVSAALTRIGYPEAAAEVRLAAFRLRFLPGASGALTAAEMAAALDLAARFPVDGGGAGA